MWVICAVPRGVYVQGKGAGLAGVGASGLGAGGSAYRAGKGHCTMWSREGFMPRMGTAAFERDWGVGLCGCAARGAVRRALNTSVMVGVDGRFNTVRGGDRP